MLIRACIRARHLLAAAAPRASSRNIKTPSYYGVRNTSSVYARPLLARPLSTEASSAPSLASLIKELRSATGAPLMECKKALSDPEVDMDVSRAMDWLRRNGADRAAKKVDGRETKEGLIALVLSDDGRSAALVRAASETDFAGRSEAFVDFVESAAAAALGISGEGDIDVAGSLLPARMAGGQGEGGGRGGTVKDALDEAVLAIRENLSVAEAVSMRASEGSVLVGYVHGRVQGSVSAGTAAAVVEIGSKTGKGGVVDVAEEGMKGAGKKLAMHIVAAKPDYLTPDSVPEEVITKEKETLMAQIADSGKPPHIVEKMIEGRLRKFYEAVCLTEQAHMVEEGGPKVSKVLGDMGMEVRRFRRSTVR